MTQHFLTAHFGEPHVSAHEAALVQALLYGRGRFRIEGLGLSVPNPTRLHVENGTALIDGRWFIITGGGEDVEIPAGSIGMQRKDRVFLSYHRTAEGIEELTLEYVVGTPTTGSPTAPTNQYPTSIFDQPTKAWIPFCDIPITGYTVGAPTMLLESRALTLPANQCEQCSSITYTINSALADCRSATTRAEEVIRSVPATLAQYDQRIKDIETLVDDKIVLMGKQINQLAAMLASNIASYVFVGETLAVPQSWIAYSEANESVMLQYTSYDSSTNKFTFDVPITLDERVEANAAKVDYLMMMAGGE